MKEALLHRRHELSMLRQDPIRTYEQQCVVERPRTIDLSLVDTDSAVELTFCAHRDKLLDRRSRHFDRRCPQPLPHLVEPIETGRLMTPGSAGIDRNESLWKYGEPYILVGGLMKETNRLIDRCVGVEDHRCRL